MSNYRPVIGRILIGITLGVIAGALAGGIALAAQPDGTPNAQPTATTARVPSRIAATYPALGRALDAGEAQELSAVAPVVARIAGRPESGLVAADTELARRISRIGEDSQYLVPGNEVLCVVSLSAGRATGGGCAPASSVAAVGTTSLTLVSGGYEVSGILPAGTAEVRITDASGNTSSVPANADHAFELFSAVPLLQLVYELPGGGRHVGTLSLPPPPALSPPAG
jgi:hypothetical protein